MKSPLADVLFAIGLTEAVIKSIRRRKQKVPASLIQQLHYSEQELAELREKNHV